MPRPSRNEEEPVIHSGLWRDGHPRAGVDLAFSSEEELAARKIHLLPTSAQSFYNFEPYEWGSTLRSIFCGTRDPKSLINGLRVHEATLVREIFSYLAPPWARHVRLTIPAPLVGNGCRVGPARLVYVAGRSRENYRKRERIVEDVDRTSSGPTDGFVAFAKCGQVSFPEPAERNVNMMPFVFGDKDSLPEDLQCYFELIEKCPYMKEEVGQVGYLTVHESYVGASRAQRREGLHIESPGFFRDDPNAAAFTPALEHDWGLGMFYGMDHFEGGIYMASSVENTSQVWDALVDKNVPEIVDRHGGCEHLRSMIGPGTMLKAGELIWMTDCTPHEAVPQTESGYRQFFRVVTPYISHWFADHSTPNPKVPLPEHVKVIQGSKFAEAWKEELGVAKSKQGSSPAAKDQQAKPQGDELVSHIVGGSLQDAPSQRDSDSASSSVCSKMYQTVQSWFH